MATTGSTLKALRLKRGRTLEELAKVTRITKSTLENLETDRRAALPAPVYVKGFIRLYCQTLQVDPREVTDLFEREEMARAQRGSLDTAVGRNVLLESRPVHHGASVGGGTTGVRVSHLVLLLVAAITFTIAVLTSRGPSETTETASRTTTTTPAAETGDTISSIARGTHH